MMAILIDLKSTAAFKRRKWQSMAARFARWAKAVDDRAEGFELRALGVAARAGFIGFTVTRDHRDAPDEARRYAGAARRYREAAYRMYERAERVERRAQGITDGPEATPLGAA
jgi:hypothetical protein